MSVQKIVVVGATGVIGREIVSALASHVERLPEIVLVASEDSVGEMYSCGERELEVVALDDSHVGPQVLALVAASHELHAQFVPRALAAGGSVIELAGSYPSIAGKKLLAHSNLGSVSRSDKHLVVAHPVAAAIAEVCEIVARSVALKHVVASTYQAVAGAGRSGLDELWGQALGIFNQQEQSAEVFPHQIAFNCIPRIGVVSDDGVTSEEARIAEDCRNLLPALAGCVSVTAVRVPVFHGDGIALTCITAGGCNLAALRLALQASSRFDIAEAPDQYPMAVDCVESDRIRIGRLRRDPDVADTVSLWIAVDSVRVMQAEVAAQAVVRLVT